MSVENPSVKQIIPTRTRRKIPHELSYPIGAERISVALAETPQQMESELQPLRALKHKEHLKHLLDMLG